MGQIGGRALDQYRTFIEGYTIAVAVRLFHPEYMIVVAVRLGTGTP
jgi:hypothetical protein